MHPPIPSEGESKTLHDNRWHILNAGNGKQSDHRPISQRDNDKILYSEGLRRLEYVTQVVPTGLGYQFHSRAVHSHKVAQVAEAIATCILHRQSNGLWAKDEILKFGGLDPTVVRTGAMMHDLGHPPYGHVGEEMLDGLARRVVLNKDDDEDPDQYKLTFEGNAQTLRIISKLETHKNKGGAAGLQLSNASITAAIKYPWSFKTGRKKYSAYIEDVGVINDARRFIEDLPASTRSLEAQIVDIADDITYAVHDIEDFYRAGLIPLKDFSDPTASMWSTWVEAIETELKKEFVQVLPIVCNEDMATTPSNNNKGSVYGWEDFHNKKLTELFTPQELVALFGDDTETLSRIEHQFGDTQQLLSPPVAAEIEQVLRKHLIPLFPISEKEDFNSSVSSIRRFSSQLVELLLQQVEPCALRGAKLSEEGRVIVAGLKWLAVEYVFKHPRIQENNLICKKKIQIAFQHFSDHLGIYCADPLNAGPEYYEVEKKRADTCEKIFVNSIHKRFGPSTEFNDAHLPSFWPSALNEHYWDVINTTLESSNYAAVPRESRYSRARLVVDAVATLSEVEIDQLSKAMLNLELRPKLA